MPKEFNEAGFRIIWKFFEEHGVDHNNETVDEILKQSGYSPARYYQYRTRWIKEHKVDTDEIDDLIASIKPEAEKGENGAISRLYADLLEKKKKTGSLETTEINADTIIRAFSKAYQELDGYPTTGERMGQMSSKPDLLPA